MSTYLVQGSNVPLTIRFQENVESLSKLVVTLWSDICPGKPLKQWNKEDMSISGTLAVCYLTEEETASLPKTILVVEIKGLDANDYTVMWERCPVKVVPRYDRKIPLTEDGG